MAPRASPDRFQAGVKKAFKEEPDAVKLVRITDGEQEECDASEISKRPGRFELLRIRTGDALMWTDSAVDESSSSTGMGELDKARARDLERAGMSHALSTSLAQNDNERLYKRVEKLEQQLDERRAEIAELHHKLATEVAGEGDEEWVKLAEVIALKLIDRQFTRELHRRLNQCKGILTGEEAKRWAEIINSPQFNAEDGQAPQLDA